MKIREIALRCFKARIVSWLTTSVQGAIAPTADGSAVVIAVYSNGRYVEPEILPEPDDRSAWGPDGPVQAPNPGV